MLRKYCSKFEKDPNTMFCINNRRFKPGRSCSDEENCKLGGIEKTGIIEKEIEENKKK